ncbi:hypothetical protein SDC9_167441 [bioreactor metagenome]|uniref:Uncharacterized protein n=1 Tax=bioreactor metagenome TaxID=1076179 RepID=A0A645G098_9ZZZZ
MAYAACTSQRLASPAATTFFATQRSAYAAERSTFEGSFPEKAPPPWRAMPPYVSTMILRPVRPASPIGPPTTNRPVGLTSSAIRSVARSRPDSASTGSTTRVRMISASSSWVTSSSCWVDTRTVSIPTGRSPSYAMVTWVLPSGRRPTARPCLRTAVSRSASRCARKIGTGISVGVSSVA